MGSCLLESIRLSNSSPGNLCKTHRTDKRAYGQYQSYQSDILKNAFLHSLHDQNQVFRIRGSG